MMHVLFFMLLLTLMGCSFVGGWLWSDRKNEKTDAMRRREIRLAREVGDSFEAYAKAQFASNILLQADNIELQNRLSDALCPRNDHIWIGGKCKRCGRRQHADEVTPRYEKSEAISAEVSA